MCIFRCLWVQFTIYSILWYVYIIQDIVTRRVTENTEKKHDCSKPLNSAGWMGSNSELTPSESLATTDDVRNNLSCKMECRLFPEKYKSHSNVIHLNISYNKVGWRGGGCGLLRMRLLTHIKLASLYSWWQTTEVRSQSGPHIKKHHAVRESYPRL